MVDMLHPYVDDMFALLADGVRVLTLVEGCVLFVLFVKVTWLLLVGVIFAVLTMLLLLMLLELLMAFVSLLLFVFPLLGVSVGVCRGITVLIWFIVNSLYSRRVTSFVTVTVGEVSVFFLLLFYFLF